MKIKKYIGATAYDAMSKLKRELGQDAIILNTRTVRQKGILGFFKKPVVEITAAYEEKKLNSQEGLNNRAWHSITKEIQDLKAMIQNISYENEYEKVRIPKQLEYYKELLIKNGVEHSTATIIVREINEQLNIQNQNDQIIKNILRYNLMEYLGEVKPLSLKPGERKVVFFIGPTGVGKTTTLAKIAAQIVVEDKYKVGLITTDTYRVAAVEQLRTYSNILNLPLEVAYNEEDAYKSLAIFKDKDLILVDTAGKNHRDLKKDDLVYKISKSIKNKEIYLVLSGTTHFNTLESIIKHYNIMDNYKIIFTKMDEAESFGNIINAKFLTKNPLSYITIGQNVPEDIEVLDKIKIVNNLIGENSHGRSS